jgi:hypothetical protein
MPVVLAEVEEYLKLYSIIFVRIYSEKVTSFFPFFKVMLCVCKK